MFTCDLRESGKARWPPCGLCADDSGEAHRLGTVEPFDLELAVGGGTGGGWLFDLECWLPAQLVEPRPADAAGLLVEDFSNFVTAAIARLEEASIAPDGEVLADLARLQRIASGSDESDFGSKRDALVREFARVCERRRRATDAWRTTWESETARMPARASILAHQAWQALSQGARFAGDARSDEWRRASATLEELLAREECRTFAPGWLALAWLQGVWRRSVADAEVSLSRVLARTEPELRRLAARCRAAMAEAREDVVAAEKALLGVPVEALDIETRMQLARVRALANNESGALEVLAPALEAEPWWWPIALGSPDFECVRGWLTTAAPIVGVAANEAAANAFDDFRLAHAERQTLESELGASFGLGKSERDVERLRDGCDPAAPLTTQFVAAEARHLAAAVRTETADALRTIYDRSQSKIGAAKDALRKRADLAQRQRKAARSELETSEARALAHLGNHEQVFATLSRAYGFGLAVGCAVFVAYMVARAMSSDAMLAPDAPLGKLLMALAALPVVAVLVLHMLHCVRYGVLSAEAQAELATLREGFRKRMAEIDAAVEKDASELQARLADAEAEAQRLDALRSGSRRAA